MNHGVENGLEKGKNPRSDFLEEFEAVSKLDLSWKWDNLETGNGIWKP